MANIMMMMPLGKLRQKSPTRSQTTKADERNCILVAAQLAINAFGGFDVDDNLTQKCTGSYQLLMIMHNLMIKCVH